MRTVNTILFSFLAVSAFAQFPKAEPRQIEDADTSFIFILANSSKIYAHSDSVTFLNDETLPVLLGLDTVGGYNRMKWRSADSFDGEIDIGDTINGGTVGSVLFIDATLHVGEDNANFFWDDTNNRLGIGDNTPDFPLDLDGNTSAFSWPRGTTAQRPSVSGSGGEARFSSTFLAPEYHDGTNWRQFASIPDGGFTAGSVIFADSDGTLTEDNANFFWDDSADELGIGTNAPDIQVHIVDASSAAMGVQATGGKFARLSVGASFGTFAFDESGDFAIGGATTISGGINNYHIIADGATGNVTIGQELPIGEVASYQLEINDATHGEEIRLEFEGEDAVGTTRKGWVTFDPDDNYIALANGAGPTRVGIDSDGDVGIGDDSPDYVLDIDASTNAVALPTGTDAQRPTGQLGLLRASSTSNFLEAHNGTSWYDLVMAADASFTAGSVIFADTDGTLTEDNANFFWEDTGNELQLAQSIQLTEGGLSGSINYDSDTSAAVDLERFIFEPEDGLFPKFYVQTEDIIGDSQKEILFLGYNNTATGNLVFEQFKGDDFYFQTRSILGSGNFYFRPNQTLSFTLSNNTGLDAAFSGTGALTLHSGTDAQRPTGAAGLFRYSTTSSLLEFHNGSTWVDVATASGHTGTQGSIFFADTDGTPTEDNANLFWDDSSDLLGIGINSPEEIVDIRDSRTNDLVAMQVQNSGGGGGDPPVILFRRSRGSVASPTAVQSGDFLGSIYINGRTDTGWEGESRVMQVEASQTWTSTAAGYSIAFYTRANGSVGGQTQRLEIANDGKVNIGGSTPSYILDIDDSTDAISLPAGTDAQRPSDHDGLLRHNTDGDAVEFEDNSTWFDIHGKGTDRAASDDVSLTYLSGDRGAIIQISDATDNATIITYTLPASPLDKTIITVECKTGSVIDADDGCRIVGNGNNIQGSSNYDFTAANKPVTIRYSSVIGEWKIIATE